MKQIRLESLKLTTSMGLSIQGALDTAARFSAFIETGDTTSEGTQQQKRHRRHRAAQEDTTGGTSDVGGVGGEKLGEG